MKRTSIIARIALPLAFSVFFTLKAYAEECYRISSVDRGNADVTLRYLSQTDTSSLVYAVLTLPDGVTEDALINVSRKVYATDGDLNYRLIGAYNVPVEDESLLEFAVLEDGDRKLNFILEFEKLPLDVPFDIIDNPSDDKAFNFKGVRVDTSLARNIDPKRFTGSTKVPVCGQYYEEGHYTMFYVRDDVFVSCYTTYGSDNFTFYITISNDSDHGILFNTGNVSVKGHKLKNRDTVEVDLPLFSKNEYVSYVEAVDRYNADNASHSEALSAVGSAVSIASIGVPWRSLEHTGLNVLGGFLRDVGNAKAKPYLAELDKTRAERTKVYLQSQSIAPGKNHSGLLRVQRPKKVKDYFLTIHMDGYDFEFADRIKE